MNSTPRIDPDGPFSQALRASLKYLGRARDLSDSLGQP